MIFLRLVSDLYAQIASLGTDLEEHNIFLRKLQTAITDHKMARILKCPFLIKIVHVADHRTPALTPGSISCV